MRYGILYVIIIWANTRPVTLTMHLSSICNWIRTCFKAYYVNVQSVPAFISSHTSLELRQRVTNFLVQQPLAGQGPLIIDVSQSRSDTPNPNGLLCMSDQPNAQTSTWQHTTLTTDRQTSMSPSGFEIAIASRKRLQTQDLDREATEIGARMTTYDLIWI